MQSISSSHWYVSRQNMLLLFTYTTLLRFPKWGFSFINVPLFELCYWSISKVILPLSRALYISLRNNLRNTIRGYSADSSLMFGKCNHTYASFVLWVVCVFSLKKMLSKFVDWQANSVIDYIKFRFTWRELNLMERK